MRSVNVFINGLRFPLNEKSSIKYILEKFFNMQCEFLVFVNSKAISNRNFESFFIKENDSLQIITYSEEGYKPHKRTIFKTDNGEI